MKKLLVCLVIGWTLAGQIDRAAWDNLTAPEKTAITSVIVDRFFERVNCGEAEVRILAGEEKVEFFTQCTKPRVEA